MEDLDEDPCSLESNVCPQSHSYTCKNSTNGTCQHKCRIDPDFCGDNGECFFDFPNSVKACK